MENVIKIVAYVRPQPQGSIKAFVPKSGKFAGRAILTSDNKNLKSFRQEVSKAAMLARHEVGFNSLVFDKHNPVAIKMDFYFEKPVSISKKRKAHVVRPDLSKLLRATEDALTGIIYFDDAQIVRIDHLEKHYGLPERVEIEVREYDPDNLNPVAIKPGTPPAEETEKTGTLW